MSLHLLLFSSSSFLSIKASFSIAHSRLHPFAREYRASTAVAAEDSGRAICKGWPGSCFPAVETPPSCLRLLTVFPVCEKRVSRSNTNQVVLSRPKDQLTHLADGRSNSVSNYNSWSWLDLLHYTHLVTSFSRKLCASVKRSHCPGLISLSITSRGNKLSFPLPDLLEFFMPMTSSPLPLLSSLSCAVEVQGNCDCRMIFPGVSRRELLRRLWSSCTSVVIVSRRG